MNETIMKRDWSSMAVPLKIVATISEIIQYAEDVFQVTLQPQKKIPKFSPGQFLHLALDKGDPYSGVWPESRVFSIASSCKQDQVKIVYSVKGTFTQKMKNNLHVGSDVLLKFPYGSFVITTEQHQGDIVLVAGGTGIAPFIPFLEEELEQPSGKKILLAYGIRGERCFLFKNLVNTCCQVLPGFELLLFDACPIDFDVLIKKTAFLMQPNYFLSGPPTMIRSLRDFLLNGKVTAECIHVDEW